MNRNINIKFIKPWEFSITLIWIYILNILFCFFLKKNKTKWFITINIIYIIIHTKLDFFSQHNIIINGIQEILINHTVPFIINKFIILNTFKINKIIFKNKIYKYINYIFLLFDQLNTIPVILFYNMLNKNLYKIKNINIILNIIYWTIIINNKIYLNKLKYILLITLKIIINNIISYYIYFNNKDLYIIYKICGEINSQKYIKNQQINGITKWLMNSMMLLLNIIIFKN